eukprot:Seg4785.1 transcript_id=Seg4785.1/GoldUCD/mRNA.D3Y31 product="hypothetical protein" protein_id=Seg4785.1/GoldUCD/D3Y31
MGPRERILNSKLEEIKVVRQAYHGNVFVRNHCKLVLKNHGTVCSVISDKTDMHTKFIELFSLFNMIQPLLFMKQRMLKDEEITLVKDVCYKFGALFPLYFPEKNITRKIHEFVFSVPRFIDRFKTTGLLSEEEGESFHAAVNMELRQLVAVRNPTEKMQLLLKRQELRSKASKNLIRRKPRMCKDCKASTGKRVFLRAGVDGQRHCPNCELKFF